MIRSVFAIGIKMKFVSLTSLMQQKEVKYNQHSSKRFIDTLDLRISGISNIVASFEIILHLQKGGM